jgi:hypothetical protein
MGSAAPGPGQVTIVVHPEDGVEFARTACRRSGRFVVHTFSDAVWGESSTAGLTMATARRLRRLYDIEAAALATASVLLGRPDPEVLAAARIRVAADVATVASESSATGSSTTAVVPEYARALLRGWAGRSLLPEEWACDVAATYLTLRLEAAERHTGVQLLDPALPLLCPVAWHERSDPGAARLSWLTRSHAVCSSRP